MEKFVMYTLPSRVYQQMKDAGGILFLRVQSEIVAVAESIDPIYIGRAPSTETIREAWQVNADLEA